MNHDLKMGGLSAGDLIRYRICYDKLFLPFHSNKSFEYKDEEVFDISIYFAYQIICRTLTFDAKCFPGFVLDPETKEVFCVAKSDSDSDKERCFGGYYMNCFYTCRPSLSSDTGYEMIRDMNVRVPDFDIFYSVDSCYKLVGHQHNYPTKISHDEFCDILKNNMNEFYHSTNLPAQSVSYLIRRV